MCVHFPILTLLLFHFEPSWQVLLIQLPLNVQLFGAGMSQACFFSLIFTFSHIEPPGGWSISCIILWSVDWWIELSDISRRERILQVNKCLFWETSRWDENREWLWWKRMIKQSSLLRILGLSSSLRLLASPLISLWFPSPYTSQLLSLLFLLLSPSQMNVLSGNSFHSLVNLL